MKLFYKKTSLAFLLILITLLVIFKFLNTNKTDTFTGTQQPETVCPTKDNFPQLWNAWSHDFFDKNPGAGPVEQAQGWSDMMRGIGCPEWANPMSGETVTHSTTTATGSTTEYYEVQLPE